VNGADFAAAAIAAVNTLCVLDGFVVPYFMGLLKDLTGNYQRGLTMLSIPMLLDAAIMLCLGRRLSVLECRPSLRQRLPMRWSRRTCSISPNEPHGHARTRCQRAACG
jgi:hypothetical protein